MNTVSGKEEGLWTPSTENGDQNTRGRSQLSEQDPQGVLFS